MTQVLGPRLLAVLYADVAGYARLVEQDQAGTVARLVRSLALVRGLIGDYGGTVANTAGDGIVAVFDSAQMALHFALEMQREMAQDAAWTPGATAIAFRIGISVGDTYIGRDGVYGHHVNLAARIQQCAKPGGICVTDAVYHLVRDNPDLRLTALGAHVLKNISAPVPIHAVAARRPLATAALPRPQRPPPTGAGRAVPDGGALAVMPLENLSRDPADLLICQSIVADLIADLGRFRQLMVIARHSSALAAARGWSLPQIGRRLGARYVLGGSFRRSGARIRIAVELSEAASGRVIWSERYDGAMAEIFDFQDDVTAVTAARVALHLDAAERHRVRLQGHPQLYPYGLVLRGQDMATRFRQNANLHARRLFEQARSLDPEYARSYAAISRTFSLEWRYHWSEDPAASLQRAVELAHQAVARDPLDARGYGELGFSQLYSKRHDDAVAAYEHALQLNPNDADLLQYAGNCLTYVRQVDRALELLDRAMRLNPYAPDSYAWALGGAHFTRGDYEQAIRAVSMMRNPSEGHRLLAAAHALLGQMDQARHHGREVMRAHPNFSIDHWRHVPPYRHAQDIQPFVTGLRLAGLT